MARGKIDAGLLKAMIKVMNDLGPDRGHTAADVVEELKERGHWAPGEAQTPERTVNMYFSENPAHFSRGLPGMYFLNEAHWLPGRVKGMSSRSAVEWADVLCAELNKAILDLPEGFYDTFTYTTTGDNYCHSITLGLLTKVLWNTPDIFNVAVDMRFNAGNGIKFQPDLVAFDNRFMPALAIDFESPNSCDCRIPSKDVDQFCRWIECRPRDMAYAIITALPDRAAERWELRYTAKGYWNECFRGRESEIRRNPYRFWYGYYEKELKSRCLDHIAFVNIDGKHARRSFPR